MSDANNNQEEQIEFKVLTNPLGVTFTDKNLSIPNSAIDLYDNTNINDFASNVYKVERSSKRKIIANSGLKSSKEDELFSKKLINDRNENRLEKSVKTNEVKLKNISNMELFFISIITFLFLLIAMYSILRLNDLDSQQLMGVIREKKIVSTLLLQFLVIIFFIQKLSSIILKKN